jgi:hypothetical protein
VQSIDKNEMARNREKLMAWQREHWFRKEDNILRLHLGSGHLYLNGYKNVDPYTIEADYKEDMRELPSFKSNTVNEIVSHHALEHIPQRDVFPTLQKWYDLLVPGGTLEIGMPDVELCMQTFLEASEKEKWDFDIFTLYGWQMEDSDTSFSLGQTHMAGFSLGRFVRMLEDIGFRMLEAYNYDGMGTPSLFIYAIKPVAFENRGTILEQDTAIGTFTNKATCIVDLWKSVNKYIPHIKFMTRFNRGGINLGMSLLREDFVASGKRYWCFLDDDIQFLNSDIIKNALELLVKEKYGAVTVYSTFNTDVFSKPYDASKLISRSAKWAVGYFIMVDSHKVGNILPDMNLPDPNTSIDTSYSVDIRMAGYDIGMSSDYVYHLFKEVKSNPMVIDITNKYLMNKYGQFYYDWCQYPENVIEWNGENK